MFELGLDEWASSEQGANVILVRGQSAHKDGVWNTIVSMNLNYSSDGGKKVVGTEVKKGSLLQQVKEFDFILNTTGIFCRIFLHRSKIKWSGVFLERSLLGLCKWRKLRKEGTKQGGQWQSLQLSKWDLTKQELGQW